MTAFTDFPGAELIERGLADYAVGSVTPESCLLAVAWGRLQRNGLLLPARTPERFPEPELQLYELLQREGGDAYARYNALLRRLIRFEQSLAQHHYRS